MTPRQHFEKEVMPQIQKELGIKNPMAVPRLLRVHVNVGIGKRLKLSKDFSDVEKNVSLITGQKPVVTRARISISNFKVTKGSPNGLTVTLRGNRMYDFIYRLVNAVFPRIRDFRGISPRAFDGRGNYAVGLQDASVFPEINPEDITNMHGLQINIITSAKDNESAKALLKVLKFPFRK